MTDASIDQPNETIRYSVKVSADGPLRIATAEIFTPSLAFLTVYTTDDTSAASKLEEAPRNLGFTGEMQKAEDL